MTNQCEKCGHIQIMNKTKSTSDKKIEYPAIFKEQELSIFSCLVASEILC